MVSFSFLFYYYFVLHFAAHLNIRKGIMT